jgi:hypothetical protein
MAMSPLSGTSVPREMVAIVCTFVFSLHWLRRLALAEPRVPSKATSPKGVCLGSNPCFTSCLREMRPLWMASTIDPRSNSRVFMRRTILPCQRLRWTKDNVEQFLFNAEELDPLYVDGVSFIYLAGTSLVGRFSTKRSCSRVRSLEEAPLKSRVFMRRTILPCQRWIKDKANVVPA